MSKIVRRRIRLESLECRRALTGWHNADLPLDVNGSGLVTATDALIVINELNSVGARPLLSQPPPDQQPSFVDTNNNGRLSPVDALLVVNALAFRSQPVNLVLSIDPSHDPNSNGVVLSEQVRLIGQTVPRSTIRIDVAGLDAALTEVDTKKQSFDLVATDDGKFSIDLPLFAGMNSVAAISRDPLGRSVSLKREIMQADIVADWNAALLNVVRDWTGLSNDPYPRRIVPSKPPVVARNMALIHTAMFEAMNAVKKEYRSYLPEPTVVQGLVSAEASGVSAAYHVAKSIYPDARELSVWESTLFETMATIPDGTPKTAGFQLGQTIASNILATRNSDGSNAAEIYSSAGLPGHWDRTAPDLLPPLLPHWGQVRPLAVQDILEYRPEPPPDLSSSQYAAAVDEVMRLGSVDSTERTPDQTEIALFWADGGGTATPPGHWNRIAMRISAAQQDASLYRARMLALLNLALADAAIASWDAKYHYDFWRPVDAIRKADSDGNELTTANTTWLPLLRTPPFPSYTSGHSTFSSAAAAVLTRIYGAGYNFASRSDSHSGLTQKPLTNEVTRQFSSFIEAAREAGQSRIYGGIHFDFDNEAGFTAGQSVGHYVMDHLLQDQRNF